MRFVFAFFALALALSLMMAEPASAAETRRGHVAGKFEMDIGGNDAGFVEPVEGAPATSKEIQERPVAKPISPQANVPTPHAIGMLKPPCLHLPCNAAATVHKTGKGLGTRNTDVPATDDTQQNSGDTSTANDPKN